MKTKLEEAMDNAIVSLILMMVDGFVIVAFVAAVLFWAGVFTGNI